jgi:hypothetical protein
LAATFNLNHIIDLLFVIIVADSAVVDYFDCCFEFVDEASLLLALLLLLSKNLLFY